MAKLDACGQCLWIRSFATAALDVESIPGGDLYLSTTYTGKIDLGGGNLTSAGTQNLAVGRLSASGAPLWSRSFGAAGAAVSLSQTSVDPAGGAAIVVSATGTVDFGGGPVNGGGALLKLDPTGAFRWQEAPFKGIVASDPCGAVLAGSGLTVEKLAP